MSRKTVLRYLERKTDDNGARTLDDKGPAWIAHVMCSRSGRKIYFGQTALRVLNKGGIYGNCMDTEGNEWWVSGVKKNGLDRHWAGSGKVFIEESAIEEYLNIIGKDKLDRTRFQVVPDFAPPDIAGFHELENKPFDPVAHAELVERHLNMKR